MSTRKVTAWWLKPLGASFLSLAFAFASPVIAQEDEEEAAVVDSEQAEVEEIIVTGSRLKRSTYNSVSPLQIIDSEATREIGLIDPASILQESTAATGVQFDTSFQGYVLDEGPGTSTLSLRGLGSQRTLVLINGRRAAPSGVEGAPAAADLNMIPGALVARYDVLLDGASSVYGSDAIAGVTNVILRKDFDGLELETYTSRPVQDGGVENTLLAAYGMNFDRGFLGIGVEYNDQEGVRFSEREWTDDCTTAYEIDENGVMRTSFLYDEIQNAQRPTDCNRFASTIVGRMSIDVINNYAPWINSAWNFYSVYYEPGEGNVLPNWSESSFPGLGSAVDIDGDGYNDIQYVEKAINGRDREAHLYAEMERINVMAYGEYTLSGENNITPFFELSYNKRETFADAGAYPLFPDVPAGNPYNPCNPDAVGGVDCGLAWDQFWSSPAGVQAQLDAFGRLFFGEGALLEVGEIGAVATTPIISVDGDRTEVTSEIEQLRFVGGARGDLPNLQWGQMRNWSWELAFSHTESEGVARRPGVRSDKMALALGAYSTTNTPCENNTGEELASDAAAGCVPVNMFAPSLYENMVGDFATAAERNYVFGSRDFRTDYTQQLLTGFLTGDLFEMPAGAALAGFGFEWRRDEIDSKPNEAALLGLVESFFRDAGAVGSKDTKELFGEIELPLLAGRPLAEELTLNLSTRVTKDEFYSSSWTYSGKVGYRPLPSLLLRATYGTSYRAPNIRENFLQSQSSFNNGFSDPCATPTNALVGDPGSEVYDPSRDERDPWVIQNCSNNGVEPGDIIRDTTYSIETFSKFGTGLEEEKSKSISYGFVWSQPFFESFDMSIGASYYRIEIRDTIIEPSSQFIANDCYNTAALNSVLCGLIVRDPDSLFVDYINIEYINRDREKVEGVDVNVSFDKSLNIFGRGYDLGIDATLNRTLELSENYLSINGLPRYDDYQGEWGVPDWKGLIQARLQTGDFTASWSTTFIGAVDVAEEYRYPNSNLYSSSRTRYTCAGPADGDVNCRPKTDAGKYMYHTASLYYRGDTWKVGIGVRNVFDEAPPRVDFRANVWEKSNTPIGYGYDLNGRTYWLNVGVQFD